MNPKRGLWLSLLFGLFPVGLWAQHRLEPTPKTVVWGYYDAASPPVLRIRSGESVEIHTLLVASPQTLEAAGVPPDQIEQQLRDIYRELKSEGPHILTGPIYVEEAQPGDVLEVRIRSVRPAIPYAINFFGGRGGFLPEDFPTSKQKIVPLDEKRGVARFSEDISIPLRPFFGSMGVAPPAGTHFGSGPPSIHAGNLDNKELVAGSVLFIPIHVAGALFQAGDGHAAQGDGEVDITALETSLVGTLEFVVRKDMHLQLPRAETPTAYITMGFDRDLTAAAKIAVREMIDFLSTEKKLSRDEAYMLASVAVDLRITQVVDGNVGVHAVLPKSLFLNK